MPALIRAARSADTAAVTDLVRRAFERYIERIGRPPMPMTLDYGAAIAEAVVWVRTAADAEDRIDGMILLREATDHLLVDVIAVDPARQNEGIGTALLNFAEARARALGHRELRLYTNERMTENLAYYPARGYREVDRRTEAGFTRVFFVKMLSG
jgi:GNAT superfamily N-acetyltransferase